MMVSLSMIAWAIYRPASRKRHSPGVSSQQPKQPMQWVSLSSRREKVRTSAAACSSRSLKDRRGRRQVLVAFMPAIQKGDLPTDHGSTSLSWTADAHATEPMILMNALSGSTTIRSGPPSKD